MLLVDAGNLLFRGMPAGRDDQGSNQALATAQGIVQAYKAMAYDAVVPGSIDLLAGADFFRQTAEIAFPWVAANLLDSKSQPVFAPHLIKKVGKIRVGIIGLTGGKIGEKGDFIIGDWRKALQKEIVILEASCDMLVVLSSLSSIENEQLQNDFNRIEIVVAADRNGTNMQPVSRQKSLMVQSGGRGKYLGKLDVRRNGTGNWQPASSPNPDQLRSTLQSIDRKLHELEQRQSQTTDSLAGQLDRLRSYRQTVADQLAKQTGTLDGQGNWVLNLFTSAFLPIRPLAGQGEVDAIVKRIKENNNDLYGSRQTVDSNNPAVRQALQSDRIVGVSSCRQCHEHQTAFWETTNHAKAYVTLKTKGQNLNPNCLVCRVTPGNITPDSNTSEMHYLLFLDSERQTIGCAVCHGAGKEHTLSPSKYRPKRLPSIELCLVCHTPERDDRFDYQSKLKAVACPASE